MSGGLIEVPLGLQLSFPNGSVRHDFSALPAPALVRMLARAHLSLTNSGGGIKSRGTSLLYASTIRRVARFFAHELDCDALGASDAAAYRRLIAALGGDQLEGCVRALLLRLVETDPDVVHPSVRPWPIAPRQFRRTLARELAFRPHGTIASKIQLKHVHAHVTEGYWGPAGESAQRFIDELDREQRAASEQRMRQRFEEWQQGLPIAGGAQHRLQQEFTGIARELDSFTGTLDEREQRLRKLLRKRAHTLHFGVLNDCHFTDPSQARCLKNASTTARDAPLIAACQPARCANASIHHDHLPGWRGVIAPRRRVAQRSRPEPQGTPP